MSRTFMISVAPYLSVGTVGLAALSSTVSAELSDASSLPVSVKEVGGWLDFTVVVGPNLELQFKGSIDFSTAQMLSENFAGADPSGTDLRIYVYSADADYSVAEYFLHPDAESYRNNPLIRMGQAEAVQFAQQLHLSTGGKPVVFESFAPPYKVQAYGDWGIPYFFGAPIGQLGGGQ